MSYYIAKREREPTIERTIWYFTSGRKKKRKKKGRKSKRARKGK